MVVTFSLTYLKVQLDVDTSTILTLMLISHIVHAAMILVFGLDVRQGGPPPRLPRRRDSGHGVLLRVHSR